MHIISFRKLNAGCPSPLGCFYSAAVCISFSLEEAETLVIEKQCKLVILDSIAFLVRAIPPGGGGGGGAMQHHHAPQQQQHSAQSIAAHRNELLGEVSSRLKSLSDKLGVACVVTNQVGARFQPSAAAAAARSEVELQAALGVAWAHAVNTRMLLQNDPTGHRFITIAKVRSMSDSCSSCTGGGAAGIQATLFFELLTLLVLCACLCICAFVFLSRRCFQARAIFTPSPPVDLRRWRPTRSASHSLAAEWMR
jgi:hypothetical protein